MSAQCNVGDQLELRVARTGAEVTVFFFNRESSRKEEKYPVCSSEEVRGQRSWQTGWKRQGSSLLRILLALGPSATPSGHRGSLRLITREKGVKKQESLKNIKFILVIKVALVTCTLTHS